MQPILILTWHLRADTSVMAFKEALLKSLFNGDTVRRFELAEPDLEQIHGLMDKRYLKWEWNYGESPKHYIKRSRRFDQGKVDVLLDIEGGIIKNCKLYGDFFGSGDLEEAENMLAGCRYEEQALYARLKTIDIDGFFSGFTAEQLLSCLY